jgi:hypothetical protein
MPGPHDDDGDGPIGGRAALAAATACGADAGVGAAPRPPPGPLGPLPLPGGLDGGALLGVFQSALRDLEDAQGGGADEEARGLLAQLEAQLAALSGGGGARRGRAAAGRAPLREAANGSGSGGGGGGGGAGPLGALDLQIASQIDRCARGRGAAAAAAAAARCALPRFLPATSRLLTPPASWLSPASSSCLCPGPLPAPRTA